MSSRLAAKREAIVAPMKLSNRIRARVVLKILLPAGKGLQILKILGAKWKLDDFKNVFTREEKIFSNEKEEEGCQCGCSLVVTCSESNKNDRMFSFKKK